MSVQGRDRIVAAYYTSWSGYSPRMFPPTSIPIELLTHVYYAFANVVNGCVVVGDSWADIEQVHNASDQSMQFSGAFGLFNDPDSPIRKRNPTLKTLISIGGATFSKEFSVVARTCSSRLTFAISVAKFIEQHQFDGTDIDWEFPVEGGHRDNSRHPDDGANFTKLLEAIREQLTLLQTRQHRCSEYLLTVATSAGHWSNKHLDLPGIARICDLINIMTYDASGPWSEFTGHHTALMPFTDNAVKEFVHRGVPRHKIAIGIPFYGRSFSGVDSAKTGSKFTGHPPGTHEPGVVDYDDIAKNYTESNGFQSHVDMAACAPMLWNSVSRVWVSYESPESAQRKARYVKEHGLAGVFCWEMSMDQSAALLQAIRSEL